MTYKCVEECTFCDVQDFIIFSLEAFQDLIVKKQSKNRKWSNQTKFQLQQ